MLWERERGVRVWVWTMSWAIRRLGWTYKQRRWEPPRNRGKNTTLLASMGPGGMGLSCLAVEGGTTGAVFEA